MFCGAFVGEVNGDGGCKGRTIGGKDVCEQCLGELKYWLEGIKARSPTTREAVESDSNEVSTDNEGDFSDKGDIEEEFEEDPFSAAPKE
jgi:hypothetical protein